MRLALLLPVVLVAGCSSAAGADRPTWHTAVAQAMSTTHRPALTDQTCRSALRLTAGGDRLRLRLSGATAASDARVRVSVRVDGAPVPVTVDGARDLLVPAGGSVLSDPVALPVAPGDALTVSLAFTGSVEPAAHQVGATTLLCSAPGSGDLTETASGEGFSYAGRQGLVVDDVAVEGGRPGVLAVGDSLTDPVLAPGTYPRWTDVLDARLPADVPVANAAVAGNRLLVPGGNGPALVDRFARDVLSRDGVGTVVLLAGTNDITAGATAAQVTGALDRLGRQLSGRRVLLATVPPASERGPELEAVRQAVNAWVRASSYEVLDADAVLRDPDRPARLRPAYDLDALHLTPAGHRALGEAVAAALG